MNQIYIPSKIQFSPFDSHNTNHQMLNVDLAMFAANKNQAWNPKISEIFKKKIL